MIQMVSHLSFWFSWFSQCHFCRCPVQTPRNRPLHGYLELLSRYPEGCFHHPELPSKTSVMSVVEHPREVLGRRKKPFVFFFVIMVRNLNFIDIVCLVAGVVAFGSLFLRHVVFFQHIVLLPRPLWQQQAPSEKCRHTWSGNWGVFHLGKPPSRIRPNSHMVRPAVRLRWQRHKNRYGPRDRLVLTKWFPALSILSRTSCAIFWYSSRCCFASHSERGLRLPFKIHTVCITSNSNNCGWKRNCSFFLAFETLLFWRLFFFRPLLSTLSTSEANNVGRHPTFFSMICHLSMISQITGGFLNSKLNTVYYVDSSVQVGGRFEGKRLGVKGLWFTKVTGFRSTYWDDQRRFFMYYQAGDKHTLNLYLKLEHHWIRDLKRGKTDKTWWNPQTSRWCSW